jgi:transposase-like protein
MRRCPRCCSTMFFTYAGIDPTLELAWKCLSCGREVLADASKQAHDDYLLGQVAGDSARQRNR